jgi:UDP:flavonoid glycosyltransferase YjiC (YdhE family)
MRPPGTPIVYGYSPSFLPPPRDWPAYCYVTGYWFLDKEQDWQPDASLLDFLRAGSPPVNIGFGSMIDRDPEAMTTLVIKALERSRQRGILLNGGGGALSRERVPDQVFLLDAIPHNWLFPHVAAVVHHGGAGTTGAGLRAGKSTLIVPFISDQRFWGDQVYERGVGPKPIAHQHLSADTLAEGIQTAVTDEEIRAKAEALGEKIRAEDGVGKAIADSSCFSRGIHISASPQRSLSAASAKQPILEEESKKRRSRKGGQHPVGMVP